MEMFDDKDPFLPKTINPETDEDPFDKLDLYVDRLYKMSKNTNNSNSATNHLNSEEGWCIKLNVIKKSVIELLNEVKSMKYEKKITNNEICNLKLSVARDKHVIDDLRREHDMFKYDFENIKNHLHFINEKINAVDRLNNERAGTLNLKFEQLKSQLDTLANVSTDSTLKPHQAVHYTSILHTINDIRSRQIHCEKQPQSPVHLAGAKNNARNVINERDRLGPDKEPWKIEKRTVCFVFGLVMLLITAMSYGWYQYHSSEDSVGSPANTETFCEAFDRLRCENGGFPLDEGDRFVCKCTNNYYGEHCAYEIRSSKNFQFLYGLFDSVNDDMRRGGPNMWWSFLPFTSDIQQRTIISFYQDQLRRIKDSPAPGDSVNGVRGLEGDAMTITRVLPPSRPLQCPTDDKLPSLDKVYNEIFQRKPDGFIPDPKHRNLLFYTFYQYFVLQFFNTDFSSTVTGSQLYGADEITQRQLRSMSKGKLKTEYLNNEHYPPEFSFSKKINMAFLRTESDGEKTHWFHRLNGDKTGGGQSPSQLWDVLADVYGTQNRRWALGHPLLSTNPMLFAMSTLWIREHNRVSEELARQRPQWTDEQVYSASKRIVVGEMMGIMMNDVLNAGSSFALRHDPDVYNGHVEYVGNFTSPFELLLMTVLPSGLPEEFNNTDMCSLLFTDNKRVLDSGIGDMVRRMVDQKMGMLTCNNDGAATEPLTKLLMKLSRENAAQSFNKYRRYLGLDAYKSFYELTGIWEIADKLESLYGDVENVELLTGMLTEKISDQAVPTFTVLTNSFIVNSILTNPLYSKTLWKSDTFDGDYGFAIVKSASIKTFICNNLVDTCDDNFTVGLYAK